MHFTTTTTNNNNNKSTISSNPLLSFLLVNILLFSLLSPLVSTAPTPVLLSDSAYTYHDAHLKHNALQARQDPNAAGGGGASPPAAATSAPAAAPAPAAPATPSPTTPAPAPASTGAGSSTQIVTTIVQAIWPDVDPLIEQAVIYFASGIPPMISNLLSSWGV